jgi:hypothetical protein
MHLPFKFIFFEKIQVNIKNLKYIPKIHQKVPNSNMSFYIIYKDYRKNLKSKFKKKLCRVPSLTLGKEGLCRVLG